MITITIGTSSIDWPKIGIEILCVFLGAICAFKYNVRMERLKEKQNLIKKIDELFNCLNFLYNDLIDLKYNIETNTSGTKINCVLADIATFQAKDYYFLSSYNPYLTSLLHKLINSFNAFLKTIEEYNTYIETQPSSVVFSKFNIESFTNIKNDYLKVIKSMIISIVILQKNLIKYKIDVLNIYSLKFSLNSIEENLKVIYPEYENDESYKLWNNTIDSIKYNFPNIYCWFCIKKEYIISCFYKLFNWFKLPQNCSKKKCLITNNNKQ